MPGSGPGPRSLGPEPGPERGRETNQEREEERETDQEREEERQTKRERNKRSGPKKKVTHSSARRGPAPAWPVARCNLVGTEKPNIPGLGGEGDTP